MTQSKHTSTPWTYTHDAVKGYVIYNQAMLDADEYGAIIASSDSAANAAFIVKAVNNHAAFINLLSTLQEAFDGMGTINEGALLFDDNRTVKQTISELLATASKE